MTRLADQQQALIAALFESPPRTLAEDRSPHSGVDFDTKNIANYLYSTGTRGLKSYQTNGQVLAHRSLSAAYPVLAQLVGAESFEPLAHALWHTHPPERGDLAQWGETLPAFVADSDQLADVPYLSDVGRVEWALHDCARRADRTAEPQTFALLAAADPAHLQLLLSPGCAVVQSAWPIVSIVSAHQQAMAWGMSSVQQSIEPDATNLPDLSAANNKLHRGEGESAVVWRYHFQPRVREAQPGEADFLRALLAGRSLGDGVDGAPALDFAAWLPMAVQSGLLLGVNERDPPNIGV